MRLLVRPTPRRTSLKISGLSARCDGCHLLCGITGQCGVCARDAPSAAKRKQHCVSGNCVFRIPLAFAIFLHSPQDCRTFATAKPRQSEPSPNREINVVRRLPQTTSLTAVIMAVSSVSQQLPTRPPRTLDLGAATDSHANEQVPTELSGQAIFDITETLPRKK